MMDFSLSQNDLEIVEGDFFICSSEIDAIAQSISIRLKTLAGEWFLNSAIGIPYLTHILGHKRSERFLRQLIMPAIECADVKEVRDFSVREENDRKISISFTAILYGGDEIKINESLGI